MRLFGGGRELEQVAQEPVGGSDATFAPFTRDEFERYGRLVKELDITTN